MDVPSLCRTLIQRLNLKGVEPDADGRLQLVFDGSLKVDIESLPTGGFILLGPLGPLAQDGRQTIVEDALAANLLNRVSTGCTVGMDPRYKALVLCRRYDGEASYQTFETVLEAFVEELQRWSDRMSQTPRRQSSPQASSESFMQGAIRI